MGEPLQLPVTRRRSPWVTAWVMALVACGASTGPAQRMLVLPTPHAKAPRQPGPSPRWRTFDAAAMNDQCEGCHQDIASEWRASLHRQSHSDPSYLRQFAVEPQPFCTGCHAPEADPNRPVPPELSALGVGCVTCHVVADEILAAPARGDHSQDGDHHQVTRTAEFSGSPACAGCHEFTFPERTAAGRSSPLFMQSTVREHAASALAHKSCADCHMPVVRSGAGSHRSHRFVASRDDAFVRSAVTFRAHFDGQQFTLTLAPGDVGHAFPTGDVLRRLVVTMTVEDATGTVVSGYRRVLARHFSFAKQRHGALRRVLLRDDRVGLEGNSVRVEFVPKITPPAGRLRYRVTYDRVAGPANGAGEIPLESSTLLTEGSLALPAPL